MDITLERMLSLIPRKADGKYVHGEKKKFCEKIGAPANIVSEWEAGKTKSYRNYIHATAMAYDVSIEWLRGQTDEKKPVQKNELSDIRRAVDEELDKMTHEELEMSLLLVRAFKNAGGST